MLYHTLRRLTSPARLLALMFFALTGFSGLASATTYTLYIHGKVSDSPGYTNGVNFHDFGYWNAEGGKSPGGPNKRALNWDGKSEISAQNIKIRIGLDCYCTGENSCHIVAHSAGNLQIGYALAQYGSGARNISFPPDWNGGAASTETCLTAYTFQSIVAANLNKPPPKAADYQQKGWNIKSVSVAGGAAGGSELAELIPKPSGLNKSLVITTARNLYDHGQTQGKSMRMYLGAKSDTPSFWLDLAKLLSPGVGYGVQGAVAAALPGEDDGAVAYHSSGGRSGRGKYCNTGVLWYNPSTYGCNKISTGTSDQAYANHSAISVDTGESYNHSSVRKLVYEASASFK